MAAKRIVKVKTEKEPMVEPEVMPVYVEKKPTSGKKFPKWPAVVAGLLVVLVLYWYKTNTWPVAAVVNGMPVMRYQVVTELYKQGGEQVLDSIITERLIRQELQKKGLSVSEKEIDDKIGQVKTSLGEGVDLNQALADRGMTMKDLRDQVGLQLGIEKAVADKVTVSDAEVNKYIADNKAYLQGTTDADKAKNARETLRQSKLQEAINTWIEAVRANGKVWRMGKTGK